MKMKRFTVALSMVVVLILAACAQSTGASCVKRTAGKCVSSSTADTMFSHSLRK